MLKKIIKHKSKAFIGYSLPVFFLLILVMFKLSNVVFRLQIYQQKIIQECENLRQLKFGLIRYYIDQEVLPIDENGMIIYDKPCETIFYIPVNCRLDANNKPFKVICHRPYVYNSNLAKNQHKVEASDNPYLLFTIVTSDGRKKEQVEHGHIEYIKSFKKKEISSINLPNNVKNQNSKKEGIDPKILKLFLPPNPDRQGGR